MKIFTLKSGVFFLIIAAWFFSLSFFEKTSDVKSDYMAAIIDKHQRANAIHTPKIILAGGSNLSFGTDSKQLEDEIGLPVVNLGLQAGLGLSFILNELKHTLKERDVVFLSLEHFMSVEGSYDIKRNTVGFYQEGSNFFERDYGHELKEYLKKKNKVFKTIISGGSIETVQNDTFLYTRKAFNPWGDLTTHLNLNKFDLLSGRTNYSKVKWAGIEEINRFQIFARENGIHVFFLFPNYPETEYAKNNKVLSWLEEDLKRNLDIEVINSVTDFVYPDSLFFDTVYHLTGEGRQKRTSKLIELIKKNGGVQEAIAAAKL